MGISVALPIGGPDDATPQGGGAPGIARLHYRVLDAQGTVLLDDYQTANGAAPATWQPLQVGLRLAQAGTVQLSVETNGAAGPTVYFDDVAVEQTGGLIVQEQHQYAFGAPLPGLSYTVGSTRYRHGYQGQFADKDEETGFDSFELRLYNSRIGRWTAPDPYGQFDSPYVGMGNNPVMGVDPDGGFFFQGTGPIAGTVATAANPSFMLGDAFVIGHRLADGLKSLATYAGMYTVNFWGGAYRGAKETGTFLGGLTPFGSNPSWQQTGQGLLNTAMIISPNPTFTMYKMQSGMQMASYMQDLPNERFNEISNDMGYGAEKLAEIFLTKKAFPLLKAGSDMKTLGIASKYYSPISEGLLNSPLGKVRIPFRVRTPFFRNGTNIRTNNLGIAFGKWGTFGVRVGLWPTVGQYLPKSTHGATGSW